MKRMCKGNCGTELEGLENYVYCKECRITRLELHGRIGDLQSEICELKRFLNDKIVSLTKTVKRQGEKIKNLIVQEKNSLKRIKIKSKKRIK